MSDWKEYRLGDIISIKSGLPYKGEYLNKGDNYLLGMGCVSFAETFLPNGARHYSDGGKPQYIGKAGDIVLATRQQSDNMPILGMPAIIPDFFEEGKVIIGSNLYMVDNKSDVDNRFLFWLLRTPQYINHIRYSQTGTTVRMITKKDIENFTFHCPPKNQRNTISSLLWNIQDKIETNRKINARLEELAQAIFKSWFIDFEPFGGKMPEDWKPCILGDLTSEWKERVKNRNDVRVLSPLSSGELALSDEYFTKQVYSKDISKYIIVKPRTFAYNPARINIGSIGINDYDFDGCVSPVYVVFKTLDGYDEFINQFIKTQLFKDEVILRAIGGVRQTLSYNDFSLIEFIKPTIEAVTQYTNTVAPLYVQMNTLNKESARLAELRDTLLPKLMSGELIPE